MDLELILSFLVALAIGGLIGMEREIDQKKKERGFAGIRTYLVVSFLGAVSSLLILEQGWGLVSYIVLGGIILFLAASYYVSAGKGVLGMTTELSVVLVFLLSMLAMIPQYQRLAVILAVVLAVVLSTKKHLRNLAKVTKQIEWNDALTFVFMTMVILPLLPNEDYTILGIENAFNPFNTWLMVVFVSGVSFIGYFLTKVVGGTHGIGLTGLLGGMVSSTAVTESMASNSKKNPKLVSSYALATVAACAVMGVRVMFEVFVIDSTMISTCALPVIVMSLIGMGVALKWFGESRSKAGEADLELGSPLSLKPALIFGLLYSLVVFLSNLMLSMGVSSYGFIALGLIAGLVDVDAITLSMTSMYAQGAVSSLVAWGAIIAAVISNTAFKMLIAKLFGTRKYSGRVSWALFAIVMAGIIAVVICIL